MALLLREEYAPGITREWKLRRVLAHEATPYQDVLIAETIDQGIGLFCNSERQSTEASQRIYHEFQVVPGFHHAQGRKHAVIIGSSEGVVTQMCQDEGFELIEHVDIDRRAVELCAEHLPYGYTMADVSEYSDRTGNIQNVRLIFQDGAQYLVGTSPGVDLIVSDLPDYDVHRGVQSNDLYSSKFFRLVMNKLHATGAFVVQAGCPTAWRDASLHVVLQQAKNVFPFVRIVASHAQDWAWLVCTKRAVDPSTAKPKILGDYKHCRSEEIFTSGYYKST